MGTKRGRSRGAVNVLFGWVRRQSMRVKVFLVAAAAIVALVALSLLVHDHNHFFIASEAVHAAGIFILAFKLIRKKTCNGISLKSQELTALFIAARLCSSLVIEKDIHTILDSVTLISTLWVIYMIRIKLKSTYIEELDSMPRYYLVVPSLLLAMFIHPFMPYTYIWIRILWAFCVYIESVSVFPQLRLMQNAKLVEPFTAHYVFALGIARFFGFAHWVIKLIETRGAYLFYIGGGLLWTPAVLIAEVVQTFILADFCYYYAKSSMLGQLVVRMPSAV